MKVVMKNMNHNMFTEWEIKGMASYFRLLHLTHLEVAVPVTNDVPLFWHGTVVLCFNDTLTSMQREYILLYYINIINVFRTQDRLFVNDHLFDMNIKYQLYHLKNKKEAVSNCISEPFNRIATWLLLYDGTSNSLFVTDRPLLIVCTTLSIPWKTNFQTDLAPSILFLPTLPLVSEPKERLASRKPATDLVWKEGRCANQGHG